MAKILIWSLGTGGRISDGKTDYRPAKYYRNDINDICETPYIYDALEKFFDFDKCVIVGTAGSGWFSLYEHLATKKTKIDNKYLEELLELQVAATHFNDDINETRIKLEKLKQTIGEKCAEIIILKYGLTTDELRFNFNSMSKIGNLIQDGDVISFDITHSFRSLAFYEFLAVSYFKDVLFKDVKIDFVSYGMLEFSGENNELTPIIDLSALVSLTDWIKSAEEYRRYGTTTLLAENLDKDNFDLLLSKEETKALKILGGDAISTHDLEEFKNLVKKCKNVIKSTDIDRRKNIALEYIFKDIADRFEGCLEDQMKLQIELSKWHMEKKRYITAAITIIEAIYDYLAKLCGQTEKKWVRGKMKKYVSSGNIAVKEFLRLYKKLGKLRNKLSHADTLTVDELDALKNYIGSLYSIYTNKFKEIPENEEAFKVALINCY